jgi:hypothetical protein
MVALQRVLGAFAVGVALLYIAVGICAFADPSFKTHLAHIAWLWLAVPVVIAAVRVGLSIRGRVNQ